MGEKQKVTIYDLAQRLGTTASTVSRALQNNPRISQKTRESVMALAKELNYIPDPIAHHLRTGKGNVLGIIVPRIDRDFFATIISAFQHVAQLHGYQIIIAASNESAEEEFAAIRSMLQKKVDGIAISLSNNTKDPLVYADYCSSAKTPLVFFDRLPDDIERFDTVANDNYQIGYDAVMQLYRRGCRKIGHFAGNMSQRSYRERYEGYCKALIERGLETNPEWVIPGITFETGYAAAQKIISMKNRPDGIFSAGDFPAISAIDTFRHKGLRVPEDIAIIGVANEPFDAYLATPLASFDLHRHHIGEKTAELLLRFIEDEDYGNQQREHVIINHNIILRDSAI